MASYIDPRRPGPVIELGPGTGPVTEALLAQGIDPSRLMLVEFDPIFCRLLRARYPAATVVQGDAYGLKRLLSGVLQQPAAGVVSGLPLFTKPLHMRLAVALGQTFLPTGSDRNPWVEMGAVPITREHPRPFQLARGGR